MACRDFPAREQGIYRLYIPTGGGKTLSSLRFALNHARRWKKRRIFYFLPYIAVTEQNAQEIRRALADEYGQVEEGLALEHHSNLLPDDEKQYAQLTERWDAPLILTTTVQFFNTLFLGKPQSARRMHSLAGAVLIFDEAQSLPVECLHLFNMACNFLAGFCGVTIVLCTATQPRLGGLNRPLLFNNPVDLIPDCHEKFERLERTIILVILNTKEAVYRLYRLLRETGNSLPPGERPSLFYLSTRLCPAHRLDRLDRLRRELERLPAAGRRNRPPVICFTTPLIEAGVDISFDCVIRSVMGLDSIAQAAGRCNRHGRDGPREVSVVNSAEERLNRLSRFGSGLRQPSTFCTGSVRKDIFLWRPRQLISIFRTIITEKANGWITPISPVKGRGAQNTLMDLFSLNLTGRTLLSSSQPGLAQAFHTAGKQFEGRREPAGSLAPDGERRG